MIINILFQCKRSCWFEQPGKEKFISIMRRAPGKEAESPESLFFYFLFWGRRLMLQTETVLKGYSATSRPSVRNCIRHDNVLLFTAINIIAPVGLLFCIVCMDLLGKQAVEETAILLRQKYWFASTNLRCRDSEIKGASLFCHGSRKTFLVAGKFGRSALSSRSGCLYAGGVF